MTSRPRPGGGRTAPAPGRGTFSKVASLDGEASRPLRARRFGGVENGEFHKMSLPGFEPQLLPSGPEILPTELNWPAEVVGTGLFLERESKSEKVTMGKRETAFLRLGPRKSKGGVQHAAGIWNRTWVAPLSPCVFCQLSWKRLLLVSPDRHQRSGRDLPPRDSHQCQGRSDALSLSVVGPWLVWSASCAG